ncbi:hypothetical protein NAV33_15270 [Pseudomonas stutzeri]|uniref:hypothetical protein n=1 Tax=Stutzerimonas stutzeri TaxID=316 RepID=UPI002109D3B4|nr:hypothetical protein [Stutzerimonas stutzeri]MCQ4313252.1 hypothetical protein [Stutzerimonas stutzeri]
MEFNKAVLDCMQTLRRRLREEQQLDIRLSQPDAIMAMLTACLGSSDETTRDLGRQLAAYSDMPPPVLAKPSPSASSNGYTPSVRIYRGQRIMA